MISRKIATNGRSLISAALDEVKNSRTDSNSRTWVLKAPIDAGLAATRVLSTRENSRVESCRSRRLPSTLSRWPRMIRRTPSRTIARATPLARIHRVSNAALGTTRS
ncbi:Uncharacterised protein [Klebsiella pneumoniae]|nr:Uncharacterised protein [Klebsiella pneumoniae]